MATQRNLDQLSNQGRNRGASLDEPTDLIESNNPDDGSDTMDPEGPIVDLIDSDDLDEPDSADEENALEDSPDEENP